jgi:hypothetical protein
MFNRKKIIDLQTRVSELEAKADVLADRLSKAYKEIEGIYMTIAEMNPAKNPVIEQKPKYRPKKKNGKENTKANK